MATVVDKRILGKPKEKYWISYIKQRIKKNKNFLGFVSGQTGSGKSFSSLRVCEELDPEFNIDRCVFGGIELMNLINSGKLKRGSAICMEEVGVEMNAKNWASVTNKMLNYLMQTFRHKGFILIMNSPFMDFVDSGTRKLFHAEMETKGIDYKKKEVFLKPLLLQYNGRMQKFYRKRLKVITPEGKVPVDLWKVNKPSDELLKLYEEKKTKYTNQLNERIYNELKKVEDKGKEKKDLTDVQQETIDLLEQGLNVEQIAISKDRSERAVQKSMEWIKKKGYKFKPILIGKKVDSYEVIEPK